MERTQLSNYERLEVRRIINEKTGYVIKSTLILNQVFRRSSLAAETGQNSNEIFEFIGDQVLSFYIVKIVSAKCGSLSLTNDYSFRIQENRFTQVKQALVNNEALAKITDQWDIAKYLLLGKSDIKNDVTKETKVKADLLEAVIGAIAIECNWDPQILETAVIRTLDLESKISTMIDNDTKARNFDIENAVNTLKELAESRQCTMPQYQFAGPDSIGYDTDGNAKWCCVCHIVNDRTGLSTYVEAASKKDAKKAAAYTLLCEHFGVQNQHGPNSPYGSWSYKDGKLLPLDKKK